ncbi:GNAT family N-acetyltransferase [Emticicia sp. BO119]|uniref:GNAT family N-acetyltransferase n=1 Tax=Emticicia sp. BO119 TaxID=2757768 RepID=UPI0015F06449|nr:GNAT family N-acetyltransferase [Emticicia sp. BO119]MBA4853791.1 GNAT family N-acetyltransferase [Emticicia sp. BO119]
MKNLIIRPAQKEEIETLLAFEQGIVTAERPFDSTLKEGEIHYYDLIYLIETPVAEVVVAEIDGQLVGSGYALIKEAKLYQKHTHYAYLGFMYVKPEHRGQGINKAILEALKQWAINKGIREIRLEVYEENIVAKNAY